MEPQKLKGALSAVQVVLFTPFDDKGEIDEKGLRQNISFLIEQSKGHAEKLVFVANGSLSEFYTLSEEEMRKNLSIIVDEVNGKAPVIAGTGTPGTKTTLKMSQQAEDIGADGVLVVLPYYHTPCADGMYEHYKTIADGINVGVIVYNNHDATKAQVSPELMSRIADIPNIVGLKENSTDLPFVKKMMKLDLEGKVRVIIGKGEFWYAACLPLGCSAFVTSIANFQPRFSLDLLKAGKRGDFKTVWKLIEDKVMPLQEFTQEVAKKRRATSVLPPQLTRDYVYLAVRKAVMPLVGLSGGAPRLPLMPLTEDEKEKLKDVVEAIGLPVRGRRS